MKFISWNVNGLRACLKKGFMDFFNSQKADFFCLQETKMYKVFLSDMDQSYLNNTSDARKVIDYIAGMTDDYFNSEYNRLIDINKN